MGQPLPCMCVSLPLASLLLPGLQGSFRLGFLTCTELFQARFQDCTSSHSAQESPSSGLSG
jgi:hypothetical protein